MPVPTAHKLSRWECLLDTIETDISFGTVGRLGL